MPAGDTVFATATGGAGGSYPDPSFPFSGGLGGVASGAFAVAPGQQLSLVVAGRGQDGAQIAGTDAGCTIAAREGGLATAARAACRTPSRRTPRAASVAPAAARLGSRSSTAPTSSSAEAGRRKHLGAGRRRWRPDRGERTRHRWSRRRPGRHGRHAGRPRPAGPDPRLRVLLPPDCRRAAARRDGRRRLLSLGTGGAGGGAGFFGGGGSVFGGAGGGSSWTKTRTASSAARSGPGDDGQRLGDARVRRSRRAAASPPRHRRTRRPACRSPTTCRPRAGPAPAYSVAFGLLPPESRWTSTGRSPAQPPRPGRTSRRPGGEPAARHRDPGQGGRRRGRSGEHRLARQRADRGWRRELRQHHRRPRRRRLRQRRAETSPASASRCRRKHGALRHGQHGGHQQQRRGRLGRRGLAERRHDRRRAPGGRERGRPARRSP